MFETAVSGAPADAVKLGTAAGEELDPSPACAAAVKGKGAAQEPFAGTEYVLVQS